MRIVSIVGIFAIFAIASIPLTSCQLQVAPVREIEETSTPGGTQARTIYAAGSAYMGNDVFKPVLWINGTPTILPLPSGKTAGQAYALQVSSGTVYIAGDVKDSENLKYPCIWKVLIGGEPLEPVLLPVPSNHTGGDPSLAALFVENGNVYAAGALVDITDTENPIRKACYWKNSDSPTFLDIPEFTSMGSVGYGGLWVLNGTVYITGVVNSELYSMPYLWKNGTANALSLPNGINEGRVYGSFFSTGFLYLAGYYVDPTSTTVPCYWKYDTESGTSTAIVLSGYTPNTANFAIVPFVDSATVYVGGGLGIPNSDMWTPAYWKNGTPIPVPYPSELRGGLVVGMTVKDGIVYLGGFYGDPEGVGSEAFIWKGGTKLAVSSPAASAGTLIFALTVE